MLDPPPPPQAYSRAQPKKTEVRTLSKSTEPLNDNSRFLSRIVESTMKLCNEKKRQISKQLLNQGNDLKSARSRAQLVSGVEGVRA